MRSVRAESELHESLERARAEALKNFGSAEVYLEKYIEEPRHVEVQLFGDQHGNVVHFGTRDCSSQRRHQKLIEEAPAPFLDDETREKIHHAAVAAAKSVGYYNAGTAEFLVKDREFYFLEINTRIQVEHPITECITGVDLVALQLRVAMGEPLPMKQAEIAFTGHAIELRINAEDSMEGFRPAIGTISRWTRPEPLPQGVREDFGYREGDSIPPFYDSLISKVIVHAPSRAEALYRTFQYLRSYVIEGVPTTIPFHAWILSNELFQTTGIDIGYVERTFTGEGAHAAMKLLRLDPAHCALQSDGSPFEERVGDGISLPAGAAGLKLVHEPGGTFLAIPLDEAGKPLQQATWRRSNTRSGALQACV
jgi:acetyl/propionyl-CoA carboxylase alpha subunit